MADDTRKRWPKLEQRVQQTGLSDEIASTGNGRDITRPWIGTLQQSPDPRLLSSVGWGRYDEVMADPEVMSTFQQRRRAVVAAEWDVQSGDDDDPRAVEAADVFKGVLERMDWDNTTDKMSFGTFYGYAVGEVMWEVHDGRIDISRIKVRHARRFRLDKDGKLRLLTSTAALGEVLPERKFWMMTVGGSHDDEVYGRGLAEWLFWPTLIKRNGIRTWALSNERASDPPKVGTYRRGSTKDQIDMLLEALMAIATDSGIALPEGMKIELLEAAKSSGGDHEKMVRYMDETIAKVVLSQTMTTSDGASLSQAEVHAGVKKEVVTADADLLNASFRAGPVRWWTDLNYGPDVAAPIVVRLLDEEADLKVMAETDTALKALGWVRTEDSFQDIYGDGYEPATPPEVTKPALATVEPGANPKLEPANDDEAGAVQRRRRALAFAALDARPLYVYRTLKNAKELIAWAKKQGFASTLKAEDMHVTVTYSRRAVDWFAMGGTFGPSTGDLAIPPGGARIVTALGNEGAIVLAFASDELQWRHNEMVEAGASWDFPEYRPHVTITYDGADVNLTKVEPYVGQLVFGPEMFEPLEADWQAGINEAAFAETGPDVVDRAVASLIEGSGYTALAPIMAPIADAIVKADSAEALDETLISALGQADVDKLIEAIGRTGFAVRIAATVDGEGSI